jgi:hypothetical protein
MLVGDMGYKQFRGWLEDYARSVKGAYRSAKELPPDSRTALVYTDCILLEISHESTYRLNQSMTVKSKKWCNFPR